MGCRKLKIEAYFHFADAEDRRINFSFVDPDEYTTEPIELPDDEPRKGFKFVSCEEYEKSFKRSDACTEKNAYLCLRSSTERKSYSGFFHKADTDSGVNVQEYTVDAVGDSSLTKQLVRGTGMGGGIGSVLYTETVSTSTKEYFCYNAIGSVVALTDVTGTVTSTTDYEAFGKEVRSTGSTEENRKFCTKERDASIGLDNFGFRYYDWELGRFTTRDPSGYPDGTNNYLYCHNNPINFIDPLGLEDNDDEKQIQQYLEKTDQGSGRSFFGTRIESDRIVETTTATGSLAQSAAGQAMAKGGELEQELAVPVSKTASELFVPGVGDVVDAKTGLDPKSSLLDKFISAGSLYLGVGSLPNVGPTVRRLKNAGGELLEKIVKKGGGKADDLTKTAVKELKEGGDEFVHIAPKAAQESIEQRGLKASSDGVVYLTKESKLTGKTTEDLSSTLYNKELQKSKVIQDRFKDGAIKVKVDGVDPKYYGVTTKPGGVPQWKHAGDIPVEKIKSVEDF